MERYIDVAVIGAGPAGLSAAVSASRAGAKRVAVFEREPFCGGILNQCIHNGFGLHYFGQELTGPEYGQRFIDMAISCGVELITGATVLSFSPQRVLTAVSPKEGLCVYKAGAIILAMGCRERTRGAIGLPGARPAGVFTAGCAQKLMNIYGYNIGKRVVILGSGDIGLIMARRLTWEGAQVLAVLEIMPYCTGLKRNIVQCLEDNNIPLRLMHTVTAVHGHGRVEGVSVSAVDSNKKPIEGTQEYIECDTLLLSVGLIPENELADEAGIELDPVTGGAVVDQDRQTSIDGIFACGNALHVHDLADNASFEAEIAGCSAAAFIHKECGEKTYIKVNAGHGIRYCVPQRLSSGVKQVEIFLRPDNVYENCALQAVINGKILKTIQKRILTPGEMEKISFTLPEEDVQSVAMQIKEADTNV